MIGEWIAAVLLVTGASFMLLAALGIVRMPDVYTRLSASTKAATLGVACVALAAAFHFDQMGTTSRAMLIILFFLITSPVAGHMIGRAAYCSGTPMWKHSVCDDRPPALPPPSRGGHSESEA